MKPILWLLIFLGVAIAVWSQVGDAGMLSLAGNIEMTLAEHDKALREPLSHQALALKNTWVPVFYGGILVATLAAIGLYKLPKK